ncbi:hypothetical protein [Oceanihabitans sediminis]|uniref:hypothetical protein n=1 Tax=Oceanihabitans sediminis TaxID=1812012 RepID=UPI003A94B571
MAKKIQIILAVLALAGAISYFLIDANEKQFDETQWHIRPLTRYKMAKDIVTSNILLGKSQDEVEDLLGKAVPSNLEGRDHLVFDLGKAPSFFEAAAESLVVIFEEDKVVKVLHSRR